MCDVDDDKPFVCSAKGCGLRFTNEDHLNVHLRKHEMSLALNPGGHSSSSGTHILDSCIADQTPTPTKFLKNCEEMGLFQELSKNPFEEAFKKASDADGVPIPGPQSNELNTPVPPTVPDRPPNFLIQETERVLPSSVSSSDVRLKQQTMVLPSDTFALDLSGQQIKEKVAMQPSSTTSEVEEDQGSVISIADSTQSPSKTLPSAIPGVSPKEVVVTQAVSSTLSSQQAAAGHQVLIASSPVTAPQSLPAAQPVLSAAPQLPGTSPNQPQQACTMQVFLQLPTGQTVPVQIPATLNAVLPAAGAEQPQAQPEVSLQPSSVATTSAILQQTQPSKHIIQQAVASAATNSTMALKQKLKQTLQAQQQQHSVVSSSVKLEPSAASPQVSPIMMSLDSPSVEYMLSDLEPPSKRPKNGASDSDDPDERRRKFLERNRAAAARCRQKRKHWICNLEKKADELQQTNSRLQSEVGLLRSEVAQLKMLLLAHQNCPITLQQKSQGQIALHTISMVEGGESVPFDLAQLVSSGAAAMVEEPITIVSDSQTFTLAPAPSSNPIISDSQTFTLAPAPSSNPIISDSHTFTLTTAPPSDSVLSDSQTFTLTTAPSEDSGAAAK